MITGPRPIALAGMHLVPIKTREQNNGNAKNASVLFQVLKN
jgi:hypothetical protein